MTYYAVERFVGQATPDQLRNELLRLATRTPPELSVAGGLWLPEDEVCFHLVRAEAPDKVIDLCRDADVGFERVLLAVEVGWP